MPQHTNDGKDFEQRIEFLFELRPDCRVRRDQRFAGKAVDLLVEQDNPLLGVQRVAVECKDHSRPLSRRTVAEILTDYAPVLEGPEIDALLLVTRHGVVANADDALASYPARHITEHQLVGALLSTDFLLRDAEAAFENASLSAYYQPASAYSLDVAFVSRYYDLYYSQLVDLAVEMQPTLESPPVDMEDVVALWKKTTGSSRLPPYIDDIKLLSRAVRKRRRRAVVPLDRIVDTWLALPSGEQNYGLALLGSYGTGKSSFARALVSKTARRYRETGGGRIPLLIELRHFGSHQSLEGLIADELSNRHGLHNVSFETFQALNAAGYFLLVLDGFDEMKEGLSRDALVYNFAEINRLLVGTAKVILCGRPTFFEGQDEQREVLAGAHHDVSQPDARYLQPEIAPMELDAVEAAITGFVTAYRRELGTDIERQAAELQSALRHDESLQQLLARPVHFPMLLRVMPSWDQPLTELRRGDLYQRFIDDTIAREMKSGRLPSFDSGRRRRFAAELAVEMFSNGESRAIRQSAIPDAIIASYRRGAETLDITRRDLVKACFLERKPPDILFFPHKSFGEYLVAWAIEGEAKSEQASTDRFALRLSPEILSFLDERLDRSAWKNILGNMLSNLRVVRAFFSDLGRDGDLVSGRDWDLVSVVAGRPAPLESLAAAVEDDETFVPLLRVPALLQAPEMVLHHVATGLESLLRAQRPVASAGQEVLRVIAWSAPDIAAVHAFRGLQLSNANVAAQFVAGHRARWEDWVERGWVQGAHRSDEPVGGNVNPRNVLDVRSGRDHGGDTFDGTAP